VPAKIYDWDGWFLRRRFVLRRGTHYDCQQSSISQQIRNAAHRRGLRINLVESEDRFTVVVQSEGEN
jgi:uncharacterized protein YheU (UPF0270 family)